MFWEWVIKWFSHCVHLRRPRWWGHPSAISLVQPTLITVELSGTWQNGSTWEGETENYFALSVASHLLSSSLTFILSFTSTVLNILDCVLKKYTETGWGWVSSQLCWSGFLHRNPTWALVGSVAAGSEQNDMGKGKRKCNPSSTEVLATLSIGKDRVLCLNQRKILTTFACFPNSLES